MADVTVYGFPISTFVNIVRLVLTHKEVAFDFHDLEPEMGSPTHLSLHPFNRLPILDHAGFRIYEMSAIALYVDEVFDGPALQQGLAPARQDVSMDQCGEQLLLPLHVLSFEPRTPDLSRTRDCSRRKGGRPRPCRASRSRWT